METLMEKLAHIFGPDLLEALELAAEALSDLRDELGVMEETKTKHANDYQGRPRGKRPLDPKNRPTRVGNKHGGITVTDIHGIPHRRHGVDRR
jgi:hypothetical protein